ncbi:MAG TPA: hypothetical protein VIP11_15215 [Gemmatimonadaceae bacterium]
MDERLPDEVTRLIDTFVASMDHVEVLLQLRGKTGGVISLEGIMAGGHVDRATTVRVLADFEVAGVVRRTSGGYEYTPSPQDSRAIDRLWDMYATRPVTLIRAVYGRSGPARLFTDALRPRPPGADREQ